MEKSPVDNPACRQAGGHIQAPPVVNRTISYQMSVDMGHRQKNDIF